MHEGGARDKRLQVDHMTWTMFMGLDDDTMDKTMMVMRSMVSLLSCVSLTHGPPPAP
jgi:hypothetical protein